MAMTQDEVKSAISSLDFSISILQRDITMSALSGEVNRITQDLVKQDTRLKELRDQGYVFDDELELKIKQNNANWRRIKPSIENDIRNYVNRLRTEMSQVDETMRRLKSLAASPVMAEPQIKRLKDSLDILEKNAKAANDAVSSRFNAIKSDVNAINTRLSTVEWMMNELHQACFKLMEVEAPVSALKVSWYHDGKESKDDPEGILFLTDQRLIFEIHEKIVKKKVLFITTASEIERRVGFETILAHVEGAEHFQEGVFKGKSHLRLLFTSQGPYSQTQFRVNSGSNEEFCRLISRIHSGELLKNRTEEVDPESLERLRNVPAECPSCGGMVTQKVLRGQNEIACEYCGFVMRF
jgi:hypothetical protein